MSTINVQDASGATVPVEKPLAPGQALSANSRPVVIASDQSAISTNAAQSGAWSITNISGTISLPTGASTSANQTTLNTAIGSTTDAAAANGAAGSALAYLRSIKDAATSTAPSPIEVGPFTPKQIAASQTNAALGATGAAGDYISHIVIQPTTTSPGVVTLYDGSTGGTNVTVYSFPGGASSLSNLAPIIIGICANCVNAGWYVTTGANVTVTAIGKFT